MSSKANIWTICILIEPDDILNSKKGEDLIRLQ
jgi:hypothetical protein